MNPCLVAFFGIVAHVSLKLICAEVHPKQKPIFTERAKPHTIKLASLDRAPQIAGAKNGPSQKQH